MPRPKRTPAQLKLAGETRKNRIRSAEVAPAEGEPKPMATLKGEALKAWKFVVANSPCDLAESDSASLTMLAETWELYCAATKQLLKTPFDKEVRTASRQFFDHLLKLLDRYGLSPKARRGLPGKGTAHDDPVNQFIVRG